MKRSIRRLLAMLMLAGILSCYAVPAVAHDDFEEQTQVQAFAAAMACWDCGFSEQDVYWPGFAWEATGWYAAWLYRVDGVDLLTEAEIRDFHRSMGMVFEFGSPDNWLGGHTPAQLRGRDGSVSYDFREYKKRIDELMGVTLELEYATGEDLTETVTVIQHLDTETAIKTAFRIIFQENEAPESSFQYQLAAISMGENGPELDPALGFDWELLMEENSLKTILASYPAVRISDKLYQTEAYTWLFLRDGTPVMLTDAYGMISGQFKGCYFELGVSTDGKTRPQIGNLDSKAGSMERLGSYITDMFSSVAYMELDRIEGDLIWANARYAGGFRQKLAFDRGSLALREVMSLADSGEVIGDMELNYSLPAPNYAFLDSWERPLRTVRVLWESYPGGLRELKSETILLPDDWEYLPYEGQSGEYTMYNNDRYIGDYAYPGDGDSYMLFLTTVKG